MRFWIRLLSSGSVTSVQSTSLGLAFVEDFPEGGDEGCFFDELSELCLIILSAAILSSFSFASMLAIVADLFRVWLETARAVPSLVGSVLERVANPVARVRFCMDLGPCCSNDTGDALWTRILGRDICWLCTSCTDRDI